MAAAVGFSFPEWGDVKQQLLAHLRRKEMLLVLDSFEHLLACSEPDQGARPELERGIRPEPGRGACPELGRRDSVALIVELLQAASGLKVLVTSRARLNAQGEQVLTLTGMDYPEPAGAQHAAPLPDDARQYSSVVLFLHGARRAQPGFELSDQELPHVARICRLAQGMPLAILLAAAWVPALSPAEIAAEVERSLDFLAADWPDVLQRHRSMRAVFDSAWRMLSETERQVFARLSVFRGGFTWEAAQAVAGADLPRQQSMLPTLMSLVNKSFLQRERTGRYDMHELMRQYAQEKLGEKADEREKALDRHAAYYAAALERWATDLWGAHYREAMAEVERELGNAGAAWAWATESGQVEHLARMADGLGRFYGWHYLFREGQLAFQAAAERVLALISGLSRTAPAQSALARRVLARLLAWQGYFTFVSGPLEAADRLFDQSASLLASPELADQDLRAERAQLLESRADRMMATDIPTSTHLSEQVLALYRELGDARGIASALMWLGASAMNTGDYREARRRYEEMLAFARSSGAVRSIRDALRTLSVITAVLGDTDTAVRLATEGCGPYPPEGGRPLADNECGFWGNVLLRLGRYAEAVALFEQLWADWAEAGQYVLLCPLPLVIWSKLHLGQYERARALAEEELEMARGQHDSYDPHTLLALSYLAIAAGAYAQAQQPLVESISLFRESGTFRDFLGEALGCMAYIDRELGQPEHAWACLHEALQLAQETGSFDLLLSALAVAALLLADQGQGERAVEVYALAWRYPAVSNSRWFQDVYGRHVAAAEAALPPEVVAAAQERGRARDPWPTVEEVLAEFERKRT